MCEKIVGRCLYASTYAPDPKCKIQRMFKNAVDDCPLLLRNISDWCVTPKMLVVFYNNNLDFNDFYKLFTWCNTYNQRKAYKKET